MAARDFVGWRYTDDNGVVYVRRADSLLVAQQGNNAPLGAVGGSSAAGLSPRTEMPRNLKPRGVIVYEASSGMSAFIVVYTAAALAAITTGTTTFDWLDAGGTVHTGVVQSKRGEPLRGTIRA